MNNKINHHNFSSIKVEDVEKALNIDENNYEAFSDSTLTVQKMLKNKHVSKRRNIQGSNSSKGRRSTLQTAKIRLNSNFFNQSEQASKMLLFSP